jgi:hypothetical protein
VDAAVEPDEPAVVEERPEPDKVGQSDAQVVILQVEATGAKAGLLKLEEAIAKVPAGLRKEMEELLRADFREVRR